MEFNKNRYSHKINEIKKMYENEGLEFSGDGEYTKFIFDCLCIAIEVGEKKYELNRELEQKLKTAIEALKYYEDESIYETDYCYNKGDQTPVVLDSGERARQALKEINGTTS